MAVSNIAIVAGEGKTGIHVVCAVTFSGCNVSAKIPETVVAWLASQGAIG